MPSWLCMYVFDCWQAITPACLHMGSIAVLQLEVIKVQVGL